MNSENKKFCSECNFYLPISKFKKVTTQSSLKKNRDGYYWCCSDCYKNKAWIYSIGKEPTNRKFRRRFKRERRIISVKNIYGLTEVEYTKKINEQNNICAICGKKDIGKVLCVDHDHDTGKVRGLLCNNCNIGLGNFKDNIKIIQSAIVYLQKYPKVVEPPGKDNVL